MEFLPSSFKVHSDRFMLTHEIFFLYSLCMSHAKFRLRGFRRLSDAVIDSLGELERKTLHEIRRQGESNVAQVCLGLDECYAYTTIMTTLDRLYKKGLLSRRKEGRAYFYEAKYSVEEMERNMAEDVIESLFDKIGRAHV